jgi:hypothetical protein
MERRLKGLEDIRQAEREVREWGKMWGILLAFLPESEQVNLMIDLYLEEGEIDLALEALQSKMTLVQAGPGEGDVNLEAPQSWRGEHDGWGGYLDWFHLACKVANAAEYPRPHAALEIYRQEIARLIERRGAGAYQWACELMGRVRVLYKLLGREAEWEAYISSLRQEHRRLTGLKRAMAQAGL